MEHKIIQLDTKQADGYVISMGLLNLVLVATDNGMVGCGAFDVEAMENFGFPAARVKARDNGRIATIDDLLKGTIKDTNSSAAKLGISEGMTGIQALNLM